VNNEHSHYHDDFDLLSKLSLPILNDYSLDKGVVMINQSAIAKTTIYFCSVGVLFISVFYPEWQSDLKAQTYPQQHDQFFTLMQTLMKAF